MTHRALSLLVLACAVPLLADAQPIRRLQQPSVSPDGKSVVFTWQGDLWIVPATGGRAERLTVHPAMEARPRWFPDGSRVAFMSARYGSNDVFTMKPDGTDLRRVTFSSSSEIPTDVSADGKSIYGYTNAWGRGDLFRVDARGGDVVQLTDHPYEAEFMPVLNADGSKVIYNRGAYATTAWQKAAMTSAALPEIWMADNTVPLSNHRRITTNEKTDLQPQSTGDGMVYYISNASGMPNVWRMKGDGSGAKQITFYSVGTARNLNVSRNGKFAVYEQDSDVYVLDTATGATKKLEVTVPGDARNNPMLELALATGASSFAVSPNGKRAVVEVRGDLFLIPEKGGTTRRLTTNPSWDTQPAWLDSRTILYVSSDGKRNLSSVTVDGKISPFLPSNQGITHPLVSPDGKTVAFHQGETEIAIRPAAGGPVKTVLRGNFVDAVDGGPMFSWSPDSKWLVANQIEGRRINVVMVPVEGGAPVTVARLVYRANRGTASTPQFLPNGKGVYFTSPEFEEQDLFVVDLVPQELTFAEDDLDRLDEPKKEEKKDVKVEVYAPGIETRMRRLTSNGAFGAIASPDSKSILVNVRSASGPSQVVSISVAGGTPTPVAAITGTVSGAEYGKDGKKLYYLSGGRLFGYTPGAPAASAIPFNAQWSVDAKEEELALFKDITWAMENLYYDAKLHGKDWPAIKARYERTVPHAYDRDDFYALMGEMMEELESSHLGADAPDVPVPGIGSDATAQLGVEFEPAALDARGVYVVSRIVPQSPASDPQSLLMVGDRILRVDGDEVGRERPLSVLLNKKAGRKVVLVVDRGGKETTVSVKPTSSAAISNLEYEAWVANERALVNRYSGGKLGYTHIRSMNGPSLERFLREIHTEAEGKQGVLIDCRYNGGGSTAVDVLAVLIRQPWLVRTTRGEMGVKISENLWRSDALELPTALLVNTYSFSNAEIIAEGFRRLKRGPIVGERTPGYVIGTGGYRLWDGGLIRMPSIGAYTIEGENLENNGRRPDHVVWFDPNAWEKGEDPQLKRAVDALLR